MPPLDAAAAAELEEELAAANLRLAQETEVPKDLETLVRKLSLRAMTISPAESAHLDPAVMFAFQQGVIAALVALDVSSGPAKRRQLRLALERMRQATHELVEGAPVHEDQSTKDVLRWLVDILDVSQQSLADLLDVHPRTFQRWLSPNDSSAPHDEDALRIRVLSRIANHLRHAFTGPGVVAWLERPHPDLKGEAPVALLNKRQEFEQLEALAAAARFSVAT